MARTPVTLVQTTPQIAVRMAPGSPYHESDALRIEREITRLMIERGGSVSADELLDAQRPVDAPLHDLFNWDDPSAAHRWRIVQAQKMLRSVEITVTRGEQPKSEDYRRAFVNVRHQESGDRRYIPVRAAAQSVNYMEQIKAQAKRAWESYEAIYGKHFSLPEFADLLGEIHRATTPYPESDLIAAD